MAAPSESSRKRSHKCSHQVFTASRQATCQILPWADSYPETLRVHLDTLRFFGIVLFFFFSKKTFPCVIQSIEIYYALFLCLFVITSQKTPGTKKCSWASHTDADYQLCTDLQRTRFNTFFAVCRWFPINLILSSIYIEFRVTAKNQKVLLDRETP